MEINWLAVIIASVSAFIIGGLWYGPLFAKKWQKLVGIDDATTKSNVARTFIGAFILTFIMAVTLAFFIGKENASFGLFAGLAAGIGWVATALGVNYLFEHKSFQLFLINAGYNVVTFALMGLIIGAF